MKINTNQAVGTGLKINKPATKKEEEIKDQLILGQGNDDSIMMGKPLVSMKSVDGAGAFAAVAMGAFAGGGALLAGIGMAGKAIGGLPGAVLAVGLTAVGGGLMAARNNDHLYYSSDKTKNVLKGALVAGGIAAAGAALNDVSKIGALGAGAALGAGSLFLPKVGNHGFIG
jgi:hypothetical protein